jgi:hypothetical protein
MEEEGEGEQAVGPPLPTAACRQQSSPVLRKPLHFLVEHGNLSFHAGYNNMLVSLAFSAQNSFTWPDLNKIVKFLKLSEISNRMKENVRNVFKDVYVIKLSCFFLVF